MRDFKKIFIFVLLAGFVILSTGQAFAQHVNSGAAANNFPHTTVLGTYYPHQTMYVSNSTQAAMNAAVSGMYNTWYADAVTTGGAGGTDSHGTQRLRVWGNFTNNGNCNYCTVSEGIGYGMLIAVMMNDQTTFNGFWAYASQSAYMPDDSGSFLMNWMVDSNGNVTGNNAATDADEDMCMALCMADKVWGSSGTYDYKSNFQNMLNAIWSREVDNGSIAVKPGDAYSSPVYSSYMTPAWYNCWGTSGVDSGGHAWSSVTNWVYNTYYGSNYSNGFVPDTQGGSQMMNDASRYPIRLGLDYLYNGTAKAGTQVNAFASAVEAGEAAVGSLFGRVSSLERLPSRLICST